MEQPLNPNQQNQRIKTPRAPSVMLWPKMALGLPSVSYTHLDVYKRQDAVREAVDMVFDEEKMTGVFVGAVDHCGEVEDLFA